MNKCEYEKNGHCTLNECMYGDFLFIDDSAFETGKYCLCDSVKQLKEQKINEDINGRVYSRRIESK